MEKFGVLKSRAVVLPLANVDTDIIAPMKRLLRNMDEMGKYAFEPIRFVNGDGDAAVPDDGFPLNRPENKDAKIMIVGNNFGCGSSREMAAQGIAEMGIRCLIGTSFGSIFHDNCFQYGILPVILDEAEVDALASKCEKGEFTVDLIKNSITAPDDVVTAFSVNEYRREMLMQGLDQIGVTLQRKAVIDAFEERDREKRPWIYAQEKRKSLPMGR